jgi:type II secretory pathway pseudopilin PulG
MIPSRSSRCRAAPGFSYIEILVAVAIIAVTLPAALEAMRTGVAATRFEGQQTAQQERLRSRMEVVLANKFATLDAAALAAGNTPTAIVTAWSDAAGTADRIVVNIYRYNGTTAVSTDTGLLWVKASMEGTALALNTLAAR